MVNRFGNIDPQSSARGQLADLPRVEAGSHQERVYNEMFKAIELLGRRLEKSEGERERLSRRLSLIESAASVDEKTGRLYLPALVDGGMSAAPVRTAMPRWAIATSGLSLCVAFWALFLAFSQGGAPQLTAQQIAVLESIASSRVASLDSRNWQPLEKSSASAADVDADTPPPITEDFNTGGLASNNLDDIRPTLTDGAPIDTPAGDALASAADPLTQIEPALGHAAGAVPHAGVTSIADDPTAKLAEAVAEEERAVEAAAEAETKITTADSTAAATPDKTASAVVVEKPAEPAVTAEKKPAAPAKAAKVAEPASGNNAVYSRIPADDKLPADLVALEKRAAEDVPAAQHDLATLYAAGRGVPQDYKRAVYWFSRAADGGIANAHYNLGVMFQQGLGVRKDVKRAVRWYRSAAELGHPEAMYNLGISYIEGIGTNRDIEKGASYFRRAADAGVAQAAYNLGVLYESNFLGAADAGKAMEWYRKAAGQKHAEAIDAVSRLQQANAQAKSQARNAADIEPAAGNN